GFGINLDWTTPYFVQWFSVPVDTEWKKYIIPIPDPSRLTREGGLFYYTVTPQPEGGSGHELWFDDIRFEKVEPGTITNPRPRMDDKTVSGFIGVEVPVSGTRTTYNVNGKDQVIVHTAKYLSFLSSDSDVAAIVDGQEINVIGMGSAEITATLRGVAVDGVIELSVNPSPVTPAPDPTEAPVDVISIFSNLYDDIQVETWAAQWTDFPGADPAEVQDFSIAGNVTKLYTDFGFAAITFENNLIDATDMEYFHVDIWVPAYVTYLRIKLVDFGEDGIYQGAPDSEGEVLLFATSDPPLVKGEWLSLDIPIERFMNGSKGLFQRAHLSQLVFEEATGGTLFVDNIYFFKSPAGE
ncbi:MAG TPA: hypothetical protein VLA34_13345, partial [Candidatus Krumholzibacterium sp.]|nr:hypothetical protein [Candidatus Krumholzibacterium sp.]